MDVYDSMFKTWFPEPKKKYSYLTSKQITKLKPRLRKDFPEDDTNLFNAVWRKIRYYANNAEILDYQQMKDLYESLVSEMVNNPRSQYYIYGYRRF
jgi:hypothetical protein